MSLPQSMSEAEIIRDLDEKFVKAQKGDCFSIKITRKNNEADSYPLTWAAFDEVTLEQIVNREEWLPDLIGPTGGGLFDFIIYHASDRKQAVSLGGIRTLVRGGTTKDPFVSVVAQPNWRGPTKLTSPRVVASGSPTVMSAPRPAETTTVPASSHADAGGFAARREQGGNSREATALIDAAEQLAKQREQFREERHRAELDAVKAEMKSSTASLESKLNSVLDRLNQPQQAQQVAKAPSMVEQLPVLMTAATPLIAMFMEQSAKRDAMMAGFQKEASDRTAQALEKLSTALSEKKPENGLGDQQAAMLKNVSEAMGSVANVAFGLVHKMSEVNGPPQEENPIVKVLGDVAKTVENLGTEYMRTVRQNLAAQTAQRVNGAAGPQQGQGQLPAAQPTNGAVQTQTQAQPQPQQVNPGPQLSVVPPLTGIDLLENLIRAKKPHEEVLDLFFSLLPGEEMQALLKAPDVNGDPEQLLKKRLGMWLIDETNAAYIMDLRDKLLDKADQLGEAEEARQEAAEAAGAAVEAAKPVIEAQPEVES